jgi:hypothetical protein
MAMPDSSYPQITFFGVAEVHTDGKLLVLRDKYRNHILTITCLHLSSKLPNFELYRHESEESLSSSEESWDEQDQNLADNAHSEDEIPF